MKKLKSILKEIGFRDRMSKGVDDESKAEFQDFGEYVGKLYQDFQDKDLKSKPEVAQKIRDLVSVEDESSLINQIKDLEFLINQLPDKPESTGKIGFRQNEDYKPSHRAYNVIDKSNNDEIVTKELPRHKALELAKTNKNYMIDATDRLAENLNPEVLIALDRFIKSMAKRYDYSERDAVFAIKAAMKQRDFLDSEDEENQSIDRPNTDIQEQKIRKLIQNEIKRIS